MKNYQKTYNVYMRKKTIKRKSLVDAVVTWIDKKQRKICTQSFDIKTQYQELCEHLNCLENDGYVQIYLEYEF